jgi:hypothetical protein
MDPDHRNPKYCYLERRKRSLGSLVSISQHVLHLALSVEFCDPAVSSQCLSDHLVSETRLRFSKRLCDMFLLSEGAVNNRLQIAHWFQWAHFEILMSSNWWLQVIRQCRSDCESLTFPGGLWLARATHVHCRVYRTSCRESSENWPLKHGTLDMLFSN